MSMTDDVIQIYGDQPTVQWLKLMMQQAEHLAAQEGARMSERDQTITNIAKAVFDALEAAALNRTGALSLSDLESVIAARLDMSQQDRGISENMRREYEKDSERAHIKRLPNGSIPCVWHVIDKQSKAFGVVCIAYDDNDAVNHNVGYIDKGVARLASNNQVISHPIAWAELPRYPPQ